MTCKHCTKEVPSPIEYCCHCGMAVKEPTAEENRDLGDIKTQIIYAVCFGIFGATLLLLSIFDSDFIWLFLFFFFLFAGLLWLIPLILCLAIERTNPLMKRDCHRFQNKDQPPASPHFLYIPR